MKITDDMIERAARAIAGLFLEPEHGETWEGVNPDWKENYRAQAAAALNAALTE